MNTDVKISTITVTKNRCIFLKDSIRHYLQQTHLNKEMLIMYYSDDDETMEYLNSLSKSWRKSNNIRIFKHIPMEGTYLGALRNHLIEQASGDFVIIWDDDDYYAPDRIAKQLDFIIKNELDACTISSLLLFSKLRQEVRLSFERHEGWEGTLMCKKSCMPLYMNMERYEDTPVIQSIFMNSNARSMHDPDLYVYYLHDSNISTAYHKEELFSNSVQLSGIKNFKVKTLIKYFK